MTSKTTDYILLQDISSAGDFLREQFHCSGNLLKKFFDKSFLQRSFKSRSTLKLPLNFINDGMINPQYEGEEIEIFYEDENFLVMNKHANQFVHPLSYDERNNCLSFLRMKHPQVLSVNEESYDRGLLYRLDFETSGVLVYVKNDELYKNLRENFLTIAKEKIYRCWVKGDCSLSGRYEHSFSSSGVKGKKVEVAPVGDYPKVGSLSLKPLRFDSVKGATLVEVKLETGLRHQIRAQMAHLGYPLVGDNLYGGPIDNRLYLHALSYRVSVGEKDFTFSKKDNKFE
jgi:23S rRNA pseudouridine1911/1915/1917 synthase